MLQVRSLAVGLAGALILALLTAAPASAAPAQLWQTCETGSAAGQCRGPAAIAADSTNGHLYVDDSGNRRVVELTAWGQFLRAWGWDVVESGPDNTGTGFEICIPVSGDQCKAGTSGSHTGQFGEFWGIALDSAGDVYVGDNENHRVQKFDPEGHFLLMFGGEVDKTSGADICTKADEVGGDVCGAGVEGTGPGEFGSWGLGNNIAIDRAGTATTVDDKVWVGEQDRIQRFDVAGAHQGDLALAGKKVRALAVDSTGFLYAAIQGDPAAYKLDPSTGTVLRTFELAQPDEFTHPHPTAVAVDSEGDVYLFSDTGIGNGFHALDRIFKFDPTGGLLESFGKEEFANLGGFATNLCPGSEAPGSFYVTNFALNGFVRAYGTPPAGCEAPPPRAPVITDQYAISASTDNALLGTRINPQFITGATYHLEYGTEPCSAGGCTSRVPLSEEQALGNGITNAQVPATPLLLEGLAPATTYHYRFVAESPGGGPEYGLRPAGQEEIEGAASFATGLEATFTTDPVAIPTRTDCPNQPLRGGPSAFLPDCRAFEMVSPVDKNGSGIETQLIFGSTNTKAEHDQSSAGGDAITYSSKTAFGDAIGGPYSSQYLARRDPTSGWLTHSLNAPHEGFPGGSNTTALDDEYQAFSPDLSEAWMIHQANPPLAPCAPADSSDLYRRDNATGGYEALHCEPNAKFAAARATIELLGTSADGCEAVFRSNSKLTEEGPAGSFYRVYESSCEAPPSADGPLHLVSLKPGGVACSEEATAGAEGVGVDNNDGRGKLVWHALSTDAHRLYWTCGKTLYLRTDPNPAVEGDETTVQVAAPSFARPPQFLTASPDGARALYTASGTTLSAVAYRLISYDAETNTSTVIATGFKDGTRRVDLLGASEDATRAYFASTEVLSTEPNSEGDTAVEGEPNLYLWQQGGGFTFVGTLGPGDLEPSGRTPSPIYPLPYHRAARVSPDGLHAAFISTARLTGFENTDLGSGEADAEVYVFDAETGRLACVSCNPSGARPRGRNLPDCCETLWAAAYLPGWQSQLYQGNPLSADGKRLFFNSFEALVNRDTNEREDVYEWEAAPDQAGCEAFGAERYVASAEGCLSLISSGQDPEDSEFVDADPSGDNVFIRTAQSLVAKDPALVDIYDARVGGGFAEPPPAAPACEGEACQSPPAPPSDPTPASSSFEGAGNVHEAAAKPKCPKGKVRRHGKCVKKHAKKKHHSRKRASANRASAR